jgi:glyoxylase-like metal-dependent hydrolase (beta-lactamase superfamily II)
MSDLTQRAVEDGRRLELDLQVFTSPAEVIRGESDRTFSPTTSTLVTGATEAALIDTQFIEASIDALGDMIAGTGKTLTTIYITHAHADHYFGLGRLLARFPAARAVATPAVVDAIRSTLDADTQWFGELFGDRLASPTAIPSPLDDTVLEVDGHALTIIEVGQGDIPSSTVVHIPALDAVVAGDVVYNQIHQMLGLSGPEQWSEWIDSVDRIEQLAPRIVVAGHKKPEASDEDVAGILDGTIRYIRDFADAVAAATGTREVVAAMQAKYPDHGNLTTLVFSAAAVMAAKG